MVVAVVEVEVTTEVVLVETVLGAVDVVVVLSSSSLHAPRIAPAATMPTSRMIRAVDHVAVVACRLLTRPR
jgi:hypothetical protein